MAFRIAEPAATAMTASAAPVVIIVIVPAALPAAAR
jgi:hypothetical protein